MATAQGPAGPRRRLGAELRRLRRKSGLHIAAVAIELDCSSSKISRLENGKGIPRMPDVIELMRLYGVEVTSERDVLTRLVRESREEGWWERFTDGLTTERFVLDAPGRYPALETEAAAVRSVSTTVLHGLLQTREYAEGVLTANLPHHESSEIARLVDLREERQRALGRRQAPLVLSAVVDEALLRRVVTSSRIMADQLRALVAFGTMRSVCIQVLPFSAGFNRALMGQFSVLELPTPLDDVVYIEGHSGDTYLSGASDVELYKNIFAEASARSLDAASSAELIKRCLREYSPREIR